MVDEFTVAVTELLTCMANAFRATEIGPFSASQAAISGEAKKPQKNKFSPVNSLLFQTATLNNFLVTINVPSVSTMSQTAV